MFLVFCIWILTFLPLLSTQIPFASDAQSYYEHTKFYIDNLSRGVYPLWDPYWNYGVPNEFFLRRIGPFNPFLLLILALTKAGLSFALSYRIYLAVYYLTGMAGFYLLAKRVIGHRLSAFTAFLLLLFSSLGTRLFDAYLHLMIVPIIWFFYFLLSFHARPSRFAFCGIVFVLLNIMTTYMPFYFLVVLGIFLPLAGVIGFGHIPGVLRQWLAFLRKHYLTAIAGFLVLFLAMLPGLSLYHQTSQGQMVLPERHSDLQSRNQLAVHIKDSANWEVLADLVYGSYYYHNLSRFRISVFYVSPVLLIILLMGLWSKINRKIVLLFCWALVLLLISAPITNPSYAFLRQHIFFFKYFKNLHFFLWIAILPIVILFCGELFRQVLAAAGTKKFRPAWILFIITAHLAVLAMVFTQERILISTYATLGLCLAFFVLTALGFFDKRQTLAFLWILLTLGLQPVEVYSQYFPENIPKQPFYTPYDHAGYLNFSFVRGTQQSISSSLDSIQWEEKSPEPLYIAAPQFYNLQHSLNKHVLGTYLNQRLLVYDRAEFFPDIPLDLPRIGKNFYKNSNVALVAQNPVPEAEKTTAAAVSPNARRITGNSPDIQVLSYNVNGVILKTNFASRKFLVFNDSYHEGWTARINTKNTPVIRSNLAFKGLWIPAGEQIVSFHYRSWPQYTLEISLLILSLLLFFMTLWWAWKDRFFPSAYENKNI